MIAPQELRIGNNVLRNGIVVTVDNQTFWDIEKYPGQYEPIDLTEEWLLKFGLKNSETGYEVIVKQTKFSAIKAKGFYSIGLAGPFGLYLVKIKYVHQFQNLYQSVFLEELTIKEQK